VRRERWNLVAAILCTVSAALVTVAAFLSPMTLVDDITLAAGAIATLGGVAWIIPAI
jgi:hypothetical protein